LLYAEKRDIGEEYSEHFYLSQPLQRRSGLSGSRPKFKTQF